jgi:hypothetical protein
MKVPGQSQRRRDSGHQSREVIIVNTKTDFAIASDVRCPSV